MTEPRVLMLVTWPLDEDTGYTVNVRRAVAALRARGVSLRIVEMLHVRPWCRRLLAGPASRDGAIPLLVPPDLGSDVLRRLSRGVAMAELAIVRRIYAPSVLHARGTRAAAMLPADHSAALRLFDVRGDIVSEMRIETSNPPERRAGARLRHAEEDSARAFERADALLYVSRSMRSWAESRVPRITGLPADVVHCSVEVSDERPVPEGEDGGVRIAYSGGLQAYQPPGEVLSQMARIGGLCSASEMSIMTRDWSEEAEAIRVRVCPRARVLSLTADEAALAIARTDIGLIPRIAHQANEVACPTKIGEYLAAGVPIAISPHLGEWPEVLARWGVGISLASADSELAAFCADVCADREAYAERCRDIAREHFSIDSAADRIIAIYSSRCRSVGSR